jgi:hypothetical protein
MKRTRVTLRATIPVTEPGCPRCGFPRTGAPECGRCGVVFAKVAPAAPPDAPARAPHTRFGLAPREERRRVTPLDVVLAAGLLAAFAWAARARLAKDDVPPEPTRAAAGQDFAPRAPLADAPAETVAPAVAAAVAEEIKGGFPELPPAVLRELATPDDLAGLSASDRETLAALRKVAQGRATLQLADIHRLEDLHERHPRVPAVTSVAQVVLHVAAENERRQGRPSEAVRYLERVTELWPESVPAWDRLLQARMADRSWREAEQSAHRALATHPDEPGFALVLAQALVMQDRTAEAVDALRRALAVRDDAAVRGLLQRLEVGLASEQGLARVQSAHFNLHLEKGASPLKGSELVRFLERKFEDLARTLECEPQGQIPVILFPSQEGLTSSGAPWWAAGTFDHSDGRIRVGTADLGAGLEQLEELLTHELAHAFIASRTGRRAPRALDEGLAQYVSGRRALARAIDPQALEVGVSVRIEDFYEAALSFVEFLLRKHGQRAMNDLLEALGRTDVEGAFGKAYGTGYAEARREWARGLR